MRCFPSFAESRSFIKVIETCKVIGREWRVWKFVLCAASCRTQAKYVGFVIYVRAANTTIFSDSRNE